jgi:hypothetical protein
MPANPEKFERILVAVPHEMREEIRRWRHRYMVDTESEAIRQLLRAGLDAGGTEATREPIARRGRSSSGSPTST